MSVTLLQLKIIKDAIVNAATDPDPDVRKAANNIIRRFNMSPDVDGILSNLSSGTKQEKLDALQDLVELLRKSRVKVEF